MRIQELDLPLVREFLKRESQDFGSMRDSPEKSNIWVDTILSKINVGLESYRGKANYLTIDSLSNVGLLNRCITLTPDPWGSKGIVEICLCTCGSPDCWGTITTPDGKKIGKKGVLPLFE